MRNLFTKILMAIIVILIFVILGIFSVIIYNEITSYEGTESVQLFESDVTEISDTVENTIETPKIIEKNSTLSKIEEVQTDESNNSVNYDNITVNKYFYDQLENYSKTIYKAFESNKEEMKTGTYRINLGDSFSSLLSRDDGQDKLGYYYQSAIEAYTYDNPDVFYLSPNKMYLNIETTTKGNSKTYNVYIDNGEEANYLVDEFSSEEEINRAISKLENIRKQIISQKSQDDYTNIKMVHDYLIDSIEYDTTISEDNIYNIYGALISKKCVCEGYARAFKYLLDGLGIETTMVIGKGQNTEGNSENHAWNYVKLDGGWYAVDCTWDDPVVLGGGSASDESKYRYFLKGENDFLQDHNPLGTFTENGKEFTYPELESDNYC